MKMKKMIDELWDGEISPQNTLISDNQEYREGNPKTKPNCLKPFRMSRKNCLKSSVPQKSN